MRKYCGRMMETVVGIDSDKSNKPDPIEKIRKFRVRNEHQEYKSYKKWCKYEEHVLHEWKLNNNTAEWGNNSET